MERFGGQFTPRTLEAAIELQSLEECAPCAAKGADFGYLPAHTYVFPATVDETRKAEAYARVAKVRAAFDGIKVEAARKEAAHEESLRASRTRQQHDDYVSATMQVAERTMDALEQRLRRMQIACAEANTLGEYYRRIIHHAGATKNMAGNKKRLMGMEQQVALSKQQVTELLHKRQGLYLEKEKLANVCSAHTHHPTIPLSDYPTIPTTQQPLPHRPNIPPTFHQPTNPSHRPSHPTQVDAKHYSQLLTKTKSLRAALDVRSELLRKDVEDKLRQFGHTRTSEIVDGWLAESLAAPGSYYGVNSTDSQMGVGEDFVPLSRTPSTVLGMRGGTPQRQQPPAPPSADMQALAGAKEGRQRGGMVLNLRPGSPETLEQPEIAVSEMVRHINEVEEVYGSKVQDNPNFADEIIEKVQSNDRLSDSLNDQQKHYEVRVASLKAELQKMHQELEDVQLGGAGGGSDKAPSGSTSPGQALSSRQVRDLDDKSFKAEIRCNQTMRRAEKANLLIQSVKTGIQHLAKLMLTQEKAGLMPPKVQGTASITLTDEDVERSNEDNDCMLHILAGCEFHVTRIREALSVGKQLDNANSGDNRAESADGKEGGGRRSSVDLLAEQMNRQILDSAEKEPGAKPDGETVKARAKKNGTGLGAVALTGSHADSDLSQVRVIARNKVDDRFTDLMEKETNRFDQRMDKLDASHVGKRGECRVGGRDWTSRQPAANTRHPPTPTTTTPPTIPTPTPPRPPPPQLPPRPRSHHHAPSTTAPHQTRAWGSRCSSRRPSAQRPRAITNGGRTCWAAATKAPRRRSAWRSTIFCTRSSRRPSSARPRGP